MPIFLAKYQRFLSFLAVASCALIAGPTSAKETADTTPYTPPAPANLTLGTVSKTSIPLFWTPAVSGNLGTNKNSGFKVYRLDGTGGTFANARVIAVIYSGTASSFTDTNVTANTAYTYKIAAFGTDNSESGNSNQVSATTPADTSSSSYGNPSSLSAALTASTTARLSWTAVGTADYFWIYRSTDSNPTYGGLIDIVGGNITSYTNSGLAPGTTYYYRVRAVKGWAEAPLESAPVTSITTSGSSGSSGSTGGGTTATSFQVTNAATSTITLAWPSIPSVDQIKLYRSTQGATNFFLPLTTVSGLTTSYIDGGLTPSTTYYYRLTTVKNGIESPLDLSAVAKASTLPYTYVAPTSITSFIATPQAGSSIILNWSYAGANVDNFHIFRNSYGSYGTFESVTLVPGTARTFIDSNLQAGVTYYYRITSIAGGIESSLSNAPQTFTTAKVDPTAPDLSYWWLYSNYNYNYNYNNYPSTYYNYVTPSTPSYATNLSATADVSHATLTWTSTGPADSFNIYQSPDNFVYFIAGSVKGGVTTFTAPYLLSGSKYWFKVTSVRNNSESLSSSAPVVSITTKERGSSTGTSVSSGANAGTTGSSGLLVPSRSKSPITFIFGSNSVGAVNQSAYLNFRYQFKNTGTTKKSFVFKEEIVSQYGSVLATTAITETIKSRATLTIPARRSMTNLPPGLYTLKVSVSEQSGKTLRYIGENDFRFRVQ